MQKLRKKKIDLMPKLKKKKSELYSYKELFSSVRLHRPLFVSNILSHRFISVACGITIAICVACSGNTLAMELSRIIEHLTGTIDNLATKVTMGNGFVRSIHCVVLVFYSKYRQNHIKSLDSCWLWVLDTNSLYWMMWWGLTSSSKTKQWVDN